MENQGEIILYQPEEVIKLEVRIENETVWLTQAQIAELFGVKQPAISKHLKNIFDSGELEEGSVYSILEYTAADGKNYRTRFYNLDAILSVGIGSIAKMRPYSGCCDLGRTLGYLRMPLISLSPQ